MILVGLMAVILLAGCASVAPGIAQDDQAGRTSQAEVALREAKAEADGLRADVATARIAAAKQEAELRELRRRVQELLVLMEARQAELITLQNERDRLAQAATIAQVHVADPATVPVGADEVNNMKTTLRELQTALAALQEELAQVKKALRPSPVSSPTMGEDKR